MLNRRLTAGLLLLMAAQLHARFEGNPDGQGWVQGGGNLALTAPRYTATVHFAYGPWFEPDVLEVTAERRESAAFIRGAIPLTEWLSLQGSWHQAGSELSSNFSWQSGSGDQVYRDRDSVLGYAWGFSLYPQGMWGAADPDPARNPFGRPGWPALHASWQRDDLESREEADFGELQFQDRGWRQRSAFRVDLPLARRWTAWGAFERTVAWDMRNHYDFLIAEGYYTPSSYTRVAMQPRNLDDETLHLGLHWHFGRPVPGGPWVVRIGPHGRWRWDLDYHRSLRWDKQGMEPVHFKLGTAINYAGAWGLSAKLGFFFKQDGPDGDAFPGLKKDSVESGSHHGFLELGWSFQGFGKPKAAPPSTEPEELDEAIQLMEKEQP